MMSEAFEAVIRMGNPGFPLLFAKAWLYEQGARGQAARV